MCGQSVASGLCGAASDDRAKLSRDPYIIHLNIAFYMVVSPLFWWESHVSNGQNVSFKEPC